MPTPRSPRSSAGSSIGEPGRVRIDGTRAEPGAEPAARPAASSYERYKQQLHSFFNGDKPLPDSLRDMLATRPGASQHGFDEDEVAAADAAVAVAAAADAPKPKKKAITKTPRTADDESNRRLVGSNSTADDLLLIEAIRKASSPREVQASVDALLARGLPLPKDAEVLGKALSHGDDGVLEQALAGLRDLVLEGAFKGNATLLKTRLKNVALLSGSSSVRDLCSEVSVRL